MTLSALIVAEYCYYAMSPQSLDLFPRIREGPPADLPDSCLAQGAIYAFRHGNKDRSIDARIDAAEECYMVF